MAKPNRGLTAMVCFVLKPTDKETLEKRANERELCTSELVRALVVDFLANNPERQKETEVVQPLG